MRRRRTATCRCGSAARTRGPWSWLGTLALMALGSLLLWVRPHGYYFFAVVAPLALLVRGRPVRERAAFAVLVMLVPWLVFGLPLRRFNLRHYGVAETHAIGRAVVAEASMTPSFRSDAEAARAELAAARATGRANPGCAAERAALATPLP